MAMMEPAMVSHKDSGMDFVVLGGGIAGMRAAIELSRGGRVLVLTKDDLYESNTEYAQGGIAAALGEDDEVTLHLHDTLLAGDGLCREEAVRVLVEEGPQANPCSSSSGACGLTAMGPNWLSRVKAPTAARAFSMPMEIPPAAKFCTR